MAHWLSQLFIINIYYNYTLYILRKVDAEFIIKAIIKQLELVSQKCFERSKPLFLKAQRLQTRLTILYAIGLKDSVTTRCLTRSSFKNTRDT